MITAEAFIPESRRAGEISDYNSTCTFYHNRKLHAEHKLKDNDRVMKKDKVRVTKRQGQGNDINDEHRGRGERTRVLFQPLQRHLITQSLLSHK